MSMTLEEAITQLEILLEYCESMMTSEYPVWRRDCEALQMLIAALRPVSRERVEKVWRGEWQMVSNGSGVCSECHRQDKIDPLAKFCRYCGAPMTDEAVQMVIERLEALHGET